MKKWIIGVADKHMRIDFSPEYLAPLPVRKSELPNAPAPRGVIDAISRKMANFGVEKVELMPSNIGYLELTAFPFPEMTAEKYVGAMDKLAGSDALVIDLRENGGGLPTSVALLASYFFDQRTALNGNWWRDTGRTDQLWTSDKLAGKHYGEQKKVAILIGPNTRSAAEDFAYTMKTLKRATLIGTRTWGGAHPAFNYRLGDHFNARIPNVRTTSPITKTNWASVGVIPDIQGGAGGRARRGESAPAGQLRGQTPVLLC